MLETNMVACTGCRACEAACPVNCISIITDEEGFLYPKVDAERCIHCGKCNKVCHAQFVDKTELTPGQMDEKFVLFGHNRAALLVEKSSSGGAFSSIAECWSAEDGVVVGAAYAEDLYVRHECCSVKNYEHLRKSKYVFSDPVNSYAQVQNYLRAGKKVLFTGTPCQVAGLKAFLGEEKENEGLLTMDFICHGTPSMQMLRDHLEYLEKKYQKKVIMVDFRSKKLGWKKHCLYCRFDDGSEYVAPWQDDYYLSLFMNYDNLRQCCYHCQYSNQHQVSDITVADFWGLEKYKPELDTDEGESLLVANTAKGKHLLSLMNAQGIMDLQPLEEAYWRYIYKEHKYPEEKRKQFFAQYHKKGYEHMEKRFQTSRKVKNVLSDVKKRLKRILKCSTEQFGKNS